MSAIGPGDYVECVDASMKHHNTAPPELTLGAIYLVEAVLAELCDIPGVGGVMVVGLHPQPDGYFRADRFRPIYRRSDKILKSVLLPVEEGVDA